MRKTRQPTPSPLAPEELLRTIRRLDRERDGGRNYLQIHLLREALPRVPRETLDRALTALVALGWLRMSLLQETRQVAPELLAAGIPAPGGTLRFYLVVMPEAPAETAPPAEPEPPAETATPSPVRQLRLELGLTQAGLAELLGCRKLAILRWEKELPSPPPLLLRAALEAHRRGCLPQPSPDDGPWGWHAALFAALAQPPVL